MEEIIDVEVNTKGRFYRVRWAGFSEEDDTWEPLVNICDRRMVDEFEEARRHERVRLRSKRKASEIEPSRYSHVAEGGPACERRSAPVPSHMAEGGPACVRPAAELSGDPVDVIDLCHEGAAAAAGMPGAAAAPLRPPASRNPARQPAPRAQGHSLRKNKPQRCSVCGGIGHKSRTCSMSVQGKAQGAGSECVQLRKGHTVTGRFMN